MTGITRVVGAMAVMVVMGAAVPLPQEARAWTTASTLAQASPSVASRDRLTAPYSQPPENYRKAKSYAQSRYRFYFVSAIYELLVLLLILRLAPRFRDWAERVSSRRMVQVIIYAPLLLVTLALLSLPADMWSHTISRGYGLSLQSWGSWVQDWITNQIITLLMGTVLIWILYGVVRRSPRRWWFYFWLASMPVMLGFFFLQPIVVDPLFFQFQPLQATQPELVSEIEKVMHRGGVEIPRERMFQMNASSKLTGLNAYVTGFGASKRVVVWDTTLAKSTTPETLFVFGHEMGHYALLHIAKESSLIAVVVLLLFYGGFHIAQWMIRRWGTAWRIRGVEDWASLPVLLFVILTLNFFATPVFDTISRYFEHEADRYGLEVIHGIVPNASQVAAAYFEKSGEVNLSDPDPSPFIVFWYFDHPSRPQRIQFAETYDPWSRGEPPRYVK